MRRARHTDRNINLDSAGRAIRELREQAGLSLGALARRMGCDKGLLSRYENGRVALSISVIEDIAAALGRPPLVVLLHCLRHRYPVLSRAGFKPCHLLDKLIQELSKPSQR